jgi:hypothetical protein
MKGLNDFRLMVTGCYDKAKKFHPIAIMITMHEASEDFQFFFAAISKHRSLFKPAVLIADAAQAITNGFKAVWPIEDRITCWAHAIRAIRKMLKSLIKEDDIRDQIQLDVLNFVKFVSKDTFTVAAQLMIKNWRINNKHENLDEFIRYFQTWWLNPKTRNWFDQVKHFTPCTNNGLESTNKYIKESNYGERLSVLDFIEELKTGFLHCWSVERNPYSEVMRNGQIQLEPSPIYKQFNTVPMITDRDYQNAWQYHKLNKYYHEVKIDGRKLHFVRSVDNPKV